MALIGHCQRILPLKNENTRLLIAEINRKSDINFARFARKTQGKSIAFSKEAGKV